MRLRSLAILSIAAATAVLAGCSSDSEPTADPTPEASAEATAPESLCDAALPSGDGVEGVEVSGTVGEEAKATFDTPLEVTEPQRAVVSEGEGDPLEVGDFVRYAVTKFSAETGEKIDAAGYGDDAAPPETAQLTSNVGVIFGCAAPGTRVAVAVPGQMAQDGTEIPGEVWILDFLDTAPVVAWGEDVEQQRDDFPSVALDDDGTPQVTIPEGYEAPDTTEVVTLKQGDGAEVKDGDYVSAQYMGVKVSDGTEFDSSWSRGMPFQTLTSGVIEGFTKALVGQKVGSQVIAVIPKEEAYAGSASDLAEEDLIFVVDILDTVSVPTA